MLGLSLIFYVLLLPVWFNSFSKDAIFLLLRNSYFDDHNFNFNFSRKLPDVLE